MAVPLGAVTDAGFGYDVCMVIATDSLDDILADLKRGLADRYRHRLRGVYVYGSCARGEADEESDLDILIVLDHVPAYGAEIDRTGALISALSLSHDRSISRAFVSQADWLHADTAFLGNVRAEAVAA